MPQRSLFIEFHILQSVPPSSINRDDSGTPKSVLYGGARRSRVSSQAWKRSTRIAFAEDTPQADRATRTKRIAALLGERLATPAEDGGTGLADADASRLAAALLQPLGISKSTKKADETAYLLFFGKHQLDRIVELVRPRAAELAALADKDLRDKVAQVPVLETLSTGHSAEVALFGRMVADLKDLNVDAAVQVAHALSTHAVGTEIDFFTAVDDEAKDQGAGMIGTKEFNSATLYRYAVLSVHQLLDNLTSPEATRQTAVRFADAFTRSMPAGNQNAFAHRTLPHLVLVTVRTDQPINLAPAFEKPVTGNQGLAAASAAALADELHATSTTWGTPPLSTLATYNLEDIEDGHHTETFGPCLPFPDLLDNLDNLVGAWLNGDTPAPQAGPR